jgi:hypothetical protein
MATTTSPDARNAPSDPSPDAARSLMEVIIGFWHSRAMFAAAALGIADHLDEPRRPEEIAGAVGADPDAVRRLLRALASRGCFREDESGRFALTPSAELLRSDHPASMRSLLRAELGQEHYEWWGSVVECVRTGETGQPPEYRGGVWRYYAEHPEEGRIFAEAMRGLTRALDAAVLSAYDFSRFGTIVDVGGGVGAMLAAILGRSPRARGVVLDVGAVAGEARRFIEREGLAERVRVVEGDFFESVPEGGDAYTLKMILHDWDDERAIHILRTVRRAMRDDATLLVMESVLAPGNEPHPGKLMDLDMLVMTGGRERTEDEFRAVFERAGFRLARVVPTHSPIAVVEAEPMPE